MLPRREKEKQKVMVARLLGGCQESLAATGTMVSRTLKEEVRQMSGMGWRAAL